LTDDPNLSPVVPQNDVERTTLGVNLSANHFQIGVTSRPNTSDLAGLLQQHSDVHPILQIYDALALALDRMQSANERALALEISRVINFTVTAAW
jgi:hypothetical protein